MIRTCDYPYGVIQRERTTISLLQHCVFIELSNSVSFHQVALTLLLPLLAVCKCVDCQRHRPVETRHHKPFTLHGHTIATNLSLTSCIPSSIDSTGMTGKIGPKISLRAEEHQAATCRGHRGCSSLFHQCIVQWDVEIHRRRDLGDPIFSYHSSTDQ